MRARTTALATAVVAAALVAAGIAVLTVLRHNLVDSASLQAEMTAHDVAAQIAVGTELSNLKLPDADSQPVQVVSSAGKVLAADDDLRDLPPMADFASAGTGSVRAIEDDDDDDPAIRGLSTTATTFGDVRLSIDHDGTRADSYRVAAIGMTTPRGQDVTIYSGASLATADRAVAGVRDAMLIGLGPLLALVAMVTWLVTRRALRPVEAIRSELAEIMGGDLSRRVPEPAARDEIARLARTTNSTLAALEAAADRQRRFIADAAHELRSPIASLRTQLEVAHAYPRLLALDGLIGDTVRLEHLAADLLLLARLDAGEQARREPVDLVAVVRDELARRAGDRHPVRAALPDAPVTVAGSRIQLGRVVTNLVDNAQRHAAATVRIAVRGGAGRAILEVADDGPGVPVADRDRIFQRFVRLDDARSRDDGGAGLGLAIVHDVVERHGGVIRVDDDALGGARFTVTLPTGDATDAASQRLS
ncbi:HAMP domain-containing histidine kinase [Nocardia sp. CDC159]|uniref:histidine kinase n=1 Tax=Nocardia pulmonis TaxID=2951408 RepID=A0A9X2J106_9NOCA|nr:MULTISPECIES: HAMP domain-containing sensor histidine kinase [Nocardia]MCM6778374.1 HAMP domain-containing histidine kinase [Nocardia pulmonis]MCM6791230.1 HAMP domain-containing histidine kinase [Nocardia sp. CDC159]